MNPFIQVNVNVIHLGNLFAATRDASEVFTTIDNEFGVVIQVSRVFYQQYD